MISVETWQTIRHLAAIGHSKRFIAKTVGVSRDTVDAAIADENPPAYKRDSPVLDALEPYRDLLLAGLQRGLTELACRDSGKYVDATR